MGFDVAAENYDRFMGRYSAHLSGQMAELAGVRPGQRVLDVGCGPGALTAELVARVGAGAVAAVDPSSSFVDAARARNPGVDVRQAAAEELPFDDDQFDAAIAQLVVHFMREPVAGLHEMARVTRRDGVVAACVWDHAGERGPLSLFWRAVREFDPEAIDEGAMAGERRGHLAALFVVAGIRDVRTAELAATVTHATFEEWWEPYTGGVARAGAYVARLDEAGRERLRERCRELLPPAPFTIESIAWAARGVA